jgi:uncharacterized protein
MTASERPWYREPMVWLVIALPLSSIVAGTSLLGLAIHVGGADPVPDEVRRMSQIQVADLGADQRALARGLSAELAIDAGTGALRLALDGIDDATLTLQFVHPTEAGQDRSLPLVRSGDAWLGRFDGSLEHPWQLRLAPADRQWRLEGRIGAQPRAVALRPRSASG